MLSVNKVLLLLLAQCISSLAQESENSTLMGVPFLFTWKNKCHQRFPLGDTHQYRFFYTSQIKDVPTNAKIVTINTPEYGDKNCGTHPQVTYTFTFDTHFYERSFISQEGTCRLLSMCYQCNNNVKALVANYSDNPSVTMLAHLFGSTFNHSLAIYPVPPQENNKLYTYKILFGAPRLGKMDGIVIETFYFHTNFTVHNVRGAIGLRNGVRYTINDGTFELIDQCELSILWIEPKPVDINCQDSQENLQDVVIVSNKPLKVFTNQAGCINNGRFNYNSQLVHEMPSTDKYGTLFILDVQQALIIPDNIKGSLKYDISLLSSQQQNTIVEITYYNRERIINTKQFRIGNTSIRIRRSAPQMEGLTHIIIKATVPVLALYTIHSQGSNDVYLSTVIQPTSWFANIQTIALSSSSNGTRQLDCQYHVSVIVPVKHSNPRYLFISEANSFNYAESSDTQEGIESIKTGDFELFYFSPENTDNDTFLVWHKDPTVDIGLTVFAYCPQRHFAYSNGYVADGAPRDLFRLPPPPDPTPIDNRATFGYLALLITLAIPIMVAISYWRWRSSKTFRVRSDEHILISREPGTDYEYDVFILFPEEDEDFVREYIYGPVRRRSYQVLWRGEKSHDLFRAGNDAMSDLATAIRISRKVIIVCTCHFAEEGAFKREVSFFTDVQKSEKMRRLIPLVIEGEYKCDQFKDFNQVRVGSREELVDSEKAEEMVERLINSIGDPINTSVESLVFV